MNGSGSGFSNEFSKASYSRGTRRVPGSKGVSPKSLPGNKARASDALSAVNDDLSRGIRPSELDKFFEDLGKSSSADSTRRCNALLNALKINDNGVRMNILNQLGPDGHRLNYKAGAGLGREEGIEVCRRNLQLVEKLLQNSLDDSGALGENETELLNRFKDFFSQKKVDFEQKEKAKPRSVDFRAVSRSKEVTQKKSSAQEVDDILEELLSDSDEISGVGSGSKLSGSSSGDVKPGAAFRFGESVTKSSEQETKELLDDFVSGLESEPVEEIKEQPTNGFSGSSGGGDVVRSGAAFRFGESIAKSSEQEMEELLDDFFSGLESEPLEETIEQPVTSFIKKFRSVLDDYNELKNRLEDFYKEVDRSALEAEEEQDFLARCSIELSDFTDHWGQLNELYNRFIGSGFTASEGDVKLINEASDNFSKYKSCLDGYYEQLSQLPRRSSVVGKLPPAPPSLSRAGSEGGSSDVGAAFPEDSLPVPPSPRRKGSKAGSGADVAGDGKEESVMTKSERSFFPPVPPSSGGESSKDGSGVGADSVLGAVPLSSFVSNEMASKVVDKVSSAAVHKRSLSLLKERFNVLQKEYDSIEPGQIRGLKKRLKNDIDLNGERAVALSVTETMNALKGEILQFIKSGDLLKLEHNIDAFDRNLRRIKSKIVREQKKKPKKPDAGVTRHSSGVSGSGFPTVFKFPGDGSGALRTASFLGPLSGRGGKEPVLPLETDLASSRSGVAAKVRFQEDVSDSDKTFGSRAASVDSSDETNVESTSAASVEGTGGAEEVDKAASATWERHQIGNILRLAELATIKDFEFNPNQPDHDSRYYDRELLPRVRTAKSALEYLMRKADNDVYRKTVNVALSGMNFLLTDQSKDLSPNPKYAIIRSSLLALNSVISTPEEDYQEAVKPGFEFRLPSPNQTNENMALYRLLKMPERPALTNPSLNMSNLYRYLLSSTTQVYGTDFTTLGTAQVGGTYTLHDGTKVLKKAEDDYQFVDIIGTDYQNIVFHLLNLADNQNLTPALRRSEVHEELERLRLLAGRRLAVEEPMVEDGFDEEDSDDVTSETESDVPLT